MGLFDSLFGSDTVETSSETDSKVRFPAQFRNLATAVGQMGSELAGRDPNQLIAGFSPDQLAAFQALRDMATTDPTGYFDVIQQLQDSGLSAGDNEALTSGLSSLTNLVQTAQNDPTVAASIDKLMADPSARDVNAETYRPGVATDTVSADQYTTAGIQDLMSPYQQQVIDQFNQNFNAQADRTRAASARERAGRQAFGSRADLAETEEDKNLLDSYNTALSGLLESGFTNAQGQFNKNTAANLDAAKSNQSARLQSGLAGMDAALRAEQGNQGKDLDLAKLGQSGAQAAGALALDQSKLGVDAASQLTAGGLDQAKLGLAGAQAAGDAAAQERATAIGNAGLVSSVGDAYQNQQQKVLDAPWTQLDRAAGVLAGVPTTASQTTTGTAPSGQASPISQIAGAGLAAYGIFSGSKDGGLVGGLDGDFLSTRGMKRMMADGGSVKLDPPRSLADMDPAVLQDMLARPNLPPEKRRQIIAALKAQGRADGGQVGVKANEPGLGERDPRYAWSLTDDTLDAIAMGFDVNDPEFYDGELAADIGANPYYSIGSVPGDYDYAGQIPDRGPMPMLPENDMTWQLMEGSGDGKATAMRSASTRAAGKLQGNPYLGASIDDLAKVLENPDLPEKLRQAALDVVAMYVRTDNFADGGQIEVNKYLGHDRDELINLLYSGTLSPAERAQVREAIANTAAVSPADYDMAPDEQSGVTAAALDQSRLARDLASNAEWMTDPENAEFFRDQAAVADSDARQLGVQAAAGGLDSPVTPLLTDDRVPVMPTAAYLPGLQPLAPISEVPPAPGFSIKGLYEAQHGGVPFSPNDPRYQQPRREMLETSIPLIDAATTAPRGTVTGAGAPYVMPDRVAAAGPGWYGSRTNVVAPETLGGLDFSQPGSMLQGVQQIIAGPAVTGTSLPSSGDGALAPGLPGSSSPLEGSPGAPPFMPPIPQRRPDMGAPAAETPLDDGDWLSRVMNNPFFQIGIAMMGSRQQGLFPAFADAASQVMGQRQAAEQAAWERSLKERGIAVDEGLLALKEQALMADMAAAAAAAAARGRGGGAGGGSGGGASAATVGAITNALDAASIARFGVPYGDLTADGQKTIEYEVGGPDFQRNFGLAVRSPAQGADRPTYIMTPDQAATMAATQDPDWDVLSTIEQIRRAEAYARGEDPTAGGFGGIGGLEFYGATPPPPSGFVLNP